MGIPFEIDTVAEVAGVLRLEARPSVGGREIPVTVTFPDLYPFFRFEVQSPTVELGHHRNPFTGALCLIGRATDEWRVSDTLAEFLATRLPQTLNAGGSDDPDEVSDQEQHQAEPFSDYYSYLSSTMLVVDGSWRIDAARGSFDAAVTGDSVGRIRGAILRVKDESGAVLATAPDEVAGVFDTRIEGRWVRSDEPMVDNDPNIIRERLAAIDPSLRQLRPARVGTRHLDVVGVVFPEEVGWRRLGDGWLFVVGIVRPRR